MNKNVQKIIIGVSIGIGCILTIIIMVGYVYFGMKLFNRVNKNKHIINNITNEIKTEYDKFVLEGINEELEDYEGIIDGDDLKELLAIIVTNNKLSGNHKISLIFNNISYDNVQKIYKLNKTINSDKEYNVVFNYDEDGYINEVIINKM